MKKIIAVINMTIDGVCDHTAGLPDEEIHQHYADLIGNADTILYGRITYQLMQFWQTLIKNPSGEKSMDDFAMEIDKIPKIVFSNTLKSMEWDSAKLSNQPIEEAVLKLKQSHNGGSKDILVGSRSLIIQLINFNLIDEFQICIYPMIEGKGLPLFDKVRDRTIFKLSKTKIFGSGAIVQYYEATHQ